MLAVFTVPGRWLRYRRSYRRCYGWQRMTPARRAIPRMSHAIPPHCVAPRNHIVGIATFADAVESSPNRIACETAPSALAACVPRRARGPDTSHVGPTLRTWARHFARGPDTSHVGPTLRTWARHFARGPDTSRVGPMVCAWVRHFVRGSDGMRGRRSGAYLGVGVRVMGLTRIVGDSRASGAPGQAPLCSQRRSPCPRHAIVGVCGRGGLYCGRHAASKRDLTVPNCDLTAIKWVELRYTGAHA